jgi:uncharacterized protein
VPETPYSPPPRAFIPLPLGDVRPTGWLADQLRIQADGLHGHLDEHHEDLSADSAWLGGSGESWEIGPYWLDGLTPLAYLLEDERLLAKVRRWIYYTLDHQEQNGWLGPRTDHQDIWWPRAVMLKVLTQYWEYSRDRRVLPAMTAYIDHIRSRLAESPLKVWAHFRWGEYLPTLLWLAEHGIGEGIPELADMLDEQGYDWTDHFAYFHIEDPVRERASLATHVVNHAMGIKYPALAALFTGLREDAAMSGRARDVMDRFHGQASGMFSGDEHLAGTNPSRGTELCAVVEYLYSMETLMSWTGDPALGDRMEALAYNALPGAFTADMWAHQYDQQANQVQCVVADRGWTNNAEANIYGLAPQYKCCMANFGQGWPKFVAHQWMGTPDGGVANVTLGPSRVTRLMDGMLVGIEAGTDYPFSGGITYRVRTAGNPKFPLSMRIPGWAEGATASINGRNPREVPAGAFHTISRAWSNGDTVTLALPMALRAATRYNDAVSLYRGPLALSLRIGQRWKQIKGDRPAADFEVYPTTPWNFAIAIDRENPSKSVDVTEHGVTMPCFSEINAPVTATVRARLLPEWRIDGVDAAPPPVSPVASAEPEETVQLIPYGAAKLRITEFPVLEG